ALPSRALHVALPIWFLPTSVATNRCSVTGCVPRNPYPRSMPVPDFLLALRKHVGHDLLPLVGVTAVVVGEDGSIVLHRRSDDGRDRNSTRLKSSHVS